jgi:hypothetical protein
MTYATYEEAAVEAMDLSLLLTLCDSIEKLSFLKDVGLICILLMIILGV